MGSFCALTISLAFPCLCYVKLFWDDLPRFDIALNLFLGTIGAVGAVYGTAVQPPAPLRLLLSRPLNITRANTTCLLMPLVFTGEHLSKTSSHFLVHNLQPQDPYNAATNLRI